MSEPVTSMVNPEWAERKWREGVELRLQALEQRDAFIEQIQKLDLKEGDILVIKTTVQFDSVRVQDLISNHVGFNVPVMIMDPADSIEVVNKNG